MGKTMIGVMAIVCALFAAACSSSSGNSGGGGGACSFDGSFTVTFGAPTGDSACPDLSAQHPTYSYAVQPNGQVSGTEPDGTTADSSNTFDFNTCKAHAVFISTKPADPGCSDPNRFTFDEAFTSTGFTGTYAFSGCGASNGTVTALACNYPMTGTKK